MFNIDSINSERNNTHIHASPNYSSKWFASCSCWYIWVRLNYDHKKLNGIKVVIGVLYLINKYQFKITITLSRFCITIFMICFSYCTVRDRPRLISLPRTIGKIKKKQSAACSFHNVQIKTEWSMYRQYW